MKTSTVPPTFEIAAPAVSNRAALHDCAGSTVTVPETSFVGQADWRNSSKDHNERFQQVWRNPVPRANDYLHHRLFLRARCKALPQTGTEEPLTSAESTLQEVSGLGLIGLDKKEKVERIKLRI